MELTKKINFRESKYMIPALIYFPLLFTGYFVIDMFGTKKAETVDPSMQTTEYLNPNLPQAKVKEGLEGKYESMLKSWGKIDDYSAVGNIDREDESAATEKYERQVSESEAEAMAIQDGAMPPGSVEESLRRSADRGEAMMTGDYPFPLTESERLIQSQQREDALREELEAALAQLRQQSEASTTGRPHLNLWPYPPRQEPMMRCRSSSGSCSPRTISIRSRKTTRSRTSSRRSSMRTSRLWTAAGSGCVCLMMSRSEASRCPREATCTLR